MRKWKFDNYEITAQKINGKSKYLLAVHLLKDGELMTGTALKTDSTDLQILEWSINAIKNYKPFSFADL